LISQCFTESSPASNSTLSRPGPQSILSLCPSTALTLSLPRPPSTVSVPSSDRKAALAGAFRVDGLTPKSKSGVCTPARYAAQPVVTRQFVEFLRLNSSGIHRRVLWWRLATCTDTAALKGEDHDEQSETLIDAAVPVIVACIIPVALQTKSPRAVKRWTGLSGGLSWEAVGVSPRAMRCRPAFPMENSPAYVARSAAGRGKRERARKEQEIESE
jgi:hypothetical protein